MDEEETGGREGVGVLGGGVRTAAMRVDDMAGTVVQMVVAIDGEAVVRAGDRTTIEEERVAGDTSSVLKVEHIASAVGKGD